jgi:glycosyltransferase involved in cell wall biosynthesis
MNEVTAPLISVIVRTQNRPHLLQRALTSLAAQTYTPLEAVVVNDGGVDIETITAPFSNTLSGGVQLFQHTHPKGRAAAANVGIHAARGEWIAFLDDDDFFEPEGLAQLAAIIPWDKDVIYGQVQVVEMSPTTQQGIVKGVLGEEYDANALVLSNIIPICAYICRRKQALAVGAFDETFTALEDWEFFYRLVQGQKVYYLPQIVANYCIWGEAHIANTNHAQELLSRQQFFQKHMAHFSAAQLAASSLCFINKINRETAAVRAYETSRLQQSELACEQRLAQLEHHHQHQLNQCEQQAAQQRHQCEQQAAQQRHQYEQQLHQCEQQAAQQLNQCRQDAQHRLHQHIQHQQHEDDRHWRQRLERVMRQTCLQMAFDLRSEIIDLPFLGLTVPMKALAGEQVSDVIAEFIQVKFPMPITQNKRLRWTFVYSHADKTTTLLLRLGTYTRVNQCHLHLQISDLDNPQNAPLEARLSGDYVEDNAYNAFALSRPLAPGRYLAELYSPDTDNRDHLMGVWLSLHFRASAHMYVPHYRYQSPPRPQLEARVPLLQHTPLFSIIVPVYNPRPQHLKACLESVLAQVYPHWELCLADDASTDTQIIDMLAHYHDLYPDRIRLIRHSHNQHIAVASNSALSLAQGEFIALLDHDDLLTEDALLEVAHWINAHPDTEYDVIYSDEDKWDERHYCYDEPYFKPDWSPELLRGQMYLGHLGIYRRSLVAQVGGFRPGFEGSQDWDLALRVTEQARAIAHIPKILYHWRKHPASTAANMDSKNYAASAGLKAVQDALTREGLGGQAELVDKNASRTLVRYPLLDKNNPPLVSIIIPSKDKADLLKPCLRSLCDNNSYPAWEIIVVDNGSEEEETLALYKEFRQRLGSQFQVHAAPGAFNFSRLVNLGVAASQGELILLLNNDTEVIRPQHWLEDMVGYARRPEIGCVGCKLLYHDNTLQHAGLAAGVHDIACHIYRLAAQDCTGYYGNLTIVSNFAGTTAAVMMVKRSLWDEIGGFDEHLAVAFNDVDFCFKVLSHGKRNLILPQVYFYHYESKSRGADDTPERRERFLQESRAVKNRWAHLWLKHDPYHSPHLSKDHDDYRLSASSPYYDNEELFDWRNL